MIHNELARWQPQAEARGIQVSQKTSDDLPKVNADPARIPQVLANLLANALRHTPKDGQIDVSLKISSGPDGQFVVTSISDTGAGIDAEDLPHLFDRFYRADQSRSKTTGGRGLGLAIVQQIIERHGGRVWVESTPGEGSVFSFSVPVAP